MATNAGDRFSTIAPSSPLLQANDDFEKGLSACPRKLRADRHFLALIEIKQLETDHPIPRIPPKLLSPSGKSSRRTDQCWIEPKVRHTPGTAVLPSSAVGRSSSDSP